MEPRRRTDLLPTPLEKGVATATSTGAPVGTSSDTASTAAARPRSPAFHRAREKHQCARSCGQHRGEPGPRQHPDIVACRPRLGPPEVCFRGRYCYLAVSLPGHRQPAPFLRLHWLGSPDEWAIGIYKASTEQYSETEFPWSYGPLTGTPEQGVEETLALYAGPQAKK
jgi:hypothetical protein